MSRSNTHEKYIVYMFHMLSSDLLIAQQDYKGALQCLYEQIKIVGELSDKTMNPRDLGSVYLRMGKCYFNLGNFSVSEDNLLLSKNYFDKGVVQDGETAGIDKERPECTFYLAKCCITSSGHVDKALTLLQETLKGVHQSLKSSFQAPHYLDDLDSSVNNLIRILRAQDKPSNTSVDIARSCFMYMGNIYDHMGKEKLARRYFEMSVFM